MAELGQREDSAQFSILDTLDEVRQEVAAGDVTSIAVILVKNNQEGSSFIAVENPLLIVGMMEELKLHILSTSGG